MNRDSFPPSDRGETTGAWVDELIDELAGVLDEIVDGKVPARLGPKFRELLSALAPMEPDIGDRRALRAAQAAYDKVIVDELLRSL